MRSWFGSFVPAGYQPLGVAGQRVIDKYEPETRPPMLPGEFAGLFRSDGTNGTANFTCLTGCATEILYKAVTFGPAQLGRKRLYAPCTGPAAPPSWRSGVLIYRINGGTKISGRRAAGPVRMLLILLGEIFFGKM